MRGHWQRLLQDFCAGRLKAERTIMYVTNKVWSEQLFEMHFRTFRKAFAHIFATTWLEPKTLRLPCETLWNLGWLYCNLHLNVQACRNLQSLCKWLKTASKNNRSDFVKKCSQERLRRIPFKKSSVVFVCQSSSSYHHYCHLIIIIIILSSSSSFYHHLIIILSSSSSYHHLTIIHHHLSPLSLLLFFSFLI